MWVFFRNTVTSSVPSRPRCNWVSRKGSTPSCSSTVNWMVGRIPLVRNPKSDFLRFKIAWHHWEFKTGAVTSRNWEVDLSHFLAFKVFKARPLSHDDQLHLTQAYRFLYPQLIARSTPFTANVTLRRYERLDVCGQTYGSLSTNSECSCYILANWKGFVLCTAFHCHRW